jgi:hypothetical protein
MVFWFASALQAGGGGVDEGKETIRDVGPTSGANLQGCKLKGSSIFFQIL